MTTQITILNRGTKAVDVTVGTETVTIQPHAHADVLVPDDGEGVITPNLAGGPGDPD